jgi:hypothetical protein
MNNAHFAARLWAVLGEDAMRIRQTIICPGCGRERPHHGRGLCRTCCDRTCARQGTRRSRAPALSWADPASRLPIPAQARCPGCPDVPACPRLALPDTGYCLRCGQLQQAAA